MIYDDMGEQFFVMPTYLDTPEQRNTAHLTR